MIHRHRQNEKVFIILATVYGIFFLVMSGFGFYDCITTDAENANWMIPVLILFMGLALLAGAIFVYVLFCNTNAGKQIDSFEYPTRLHIKDERKSL